MPERPIYLDYNATTPVDPRVLDAMLPYLRTEFGNPSSQHGYGLPARTAIARAREEVAALIGASPDEITFTSGGTESTNHALKGLATASRAALGDRDEIVISTIEHPATVETTQALARNGFHVRLAPVDHDGLLDLDALERCLSDRTLAVSLMHANNETGTVQPIAEASKSVHACGAMLHVDAAQSAGKIPLDVSALGIDLLTIAGHKLYAPKGVGALFVRRGIRLEPLIHGAGQESGARAGTENVPYAVALGTACRLAKELLPEAAPRMRVLRDRLQTALVAGLREDVVLNGHPEKRLPNTLNMSFRGLVGAELLAATAAIAASTGSACHDGRVTISPVLAAMGIDPTIARGAVRFSVGRTTVADEIDQAAAIVIERARELRGRAAP
jgi:cysteine desulfurase